MMDFLIFLGEWALIALAGAVSFGIVAHRMAGEDAQAEEDAS